VDIFKETCAFLLSSSLAPSRQLTHAQADRMGTCYTERKKTKRAVSKVSGQEGLSSWSQISTAKWTAKKDWFPLFIFSKVRIYCSLLNVRKRGWNYSIVFLDAVLFISTILVNQIAEKSSGCAKHPDSSSHSQERSNPFFKNYILNLFRHKTRGQ